MDFEKGGRGAIDRMIEAYGCGTKTALAEKLGISKGTLSNRYIRDSFPADLVIQCALETDVSLKWLATGTGPLHENNVQDILTLNKAKLIDGALLDAGYLYFDKTANSAELKKPFSVTFENTIFIVESEIQDITNGEWLVKIEGDVSIKQITKIPINKISVYDKKRDLSFECLASDIDVLGLIKVKIIN